MTGQANNKCSLNLYNVYIENIKFDRSQDFDSKKQESDFELKLHPTVQLSKDHKNCRCIFKAIIHDNDKKLLNIEVTIVGLFNIIDFDKIDKNIRDSLLSKNTLAILFPYLRSFITTITSQSGIKPIILPVINISALVDSRKFSKDNTIKQENKK